MTLATRLTYCLHMCTSRVVVARLVSLFYSTLGNILPQMSHTLLLSLPKCGYTWSWNLTLLQADAIPAVCGVVKSGKVPPDVRALALGMLSHTARHGVDLAKRVMASGVMDASLQVCGSTEHAKQISHALVGRLMSSTTTPKTCWLVQ